MNFPTLLKRPRHEMKPESPATVAPSLQPAWTRDLILLAVALPFAFLLFAAVYIGF